MTSALVESHVTSVDTDDISNSVNNWEILEPLRVEEESGMVRLGSLRVEGFVSDLERADVVVLVSLVGEGGIEHHGIDVELLTGDLRSLSKLSVGVLRMY